MKWSVVFGIVALAAFTAAFPNPNLDIVENESGELFGLVPLHRHQRSCGGYGNNRHNTGRIYGNMDITDPGRVFIGAKHTPINNNDHLLKTHVFATDNIRHHSPLTVGGEASYLHKPTGSFLDAKAIHTERMGTDLSASGKYNFFQDKTTNANVEGFVSKHLGGLPGNQPTDYGVMLNVEKKF